MFYQSFSSKTSFPIPVSKNGTFTSSGATVTLFNSTDLQAGDYLYSTSLNEVKKIISFGATNTLTIESAFTTDITVNEVIKITDRIVFSEVDVFNYGGANGKFNGQTMANNTIFNIEKKNDSLVFTIDGTSTSISILAVL